MSKILTNIKKIRTQLGYSQEFMAGELGIEQVSYGLVENGKRKLTYDRLEQIAIVFGMSVIDVIAYPSVYEEKKDNEVVKSTRVTLQIEIEEEDIKANVIKLTFGDRVLEIKNQNK